MKINIAGGTGIMGRVHKSLFENAGHKVIVSGRNSSPNLEESADMADLTIISVPISATEDIIRKVAPYSRALMDFTGIKQAPIEAMLKYSSANTEVAGLHPLYGNVQSLEGKTIVYCPTERSKEKCTEVVDAFKRAGLIVKEMDPREHDLVVGGIAQSARQIILESFALLMSQYGLKAEEIYSISPPPTQQLLNLISRQVDSSNDKLYREMRSNNPYTGELIRKIITNLENPDPNSPQIIRNSFGEEFLKISQQRARKMIDEPNR